MSTDHMVTVFYGYMKLESWHVRRGDDLVFMGRADRYDRDGTLVERGKPSEISVLHLNGWEPPL